MPLPWFGYRGGGVLEVRVAAFDDHVAGLEQRGELVDHRVDGVAALDHDDQAAQALQGLDKLRRGP